MTGQLDGRTVVVAGAATGAGAAAVQVLSEAGARVFGLYRSSRPTPAVEALATWLPCDLRDREATHRVFAEVHGIAGRIDVLINAAGLWAPGSPSDLTDAEIDDMIGINLKSAIFANQAAYEHMRSTGGQIVNFGSVEGISGNARSAAYAVAKAGVHAWTRSAALAWAADRVTVNTVIPVVQTTNATRISEFFGPDGAEILKERMKGFIPLGGAMGDPVRDLGPVLVFLASEGAHFMTGQVISVDGGMRMIGA